MESTQPRRASPRLWQFHGGLHLPDNKTQSIGKPLRRAALPKRLILPLQQHIGEPAQPLVKVGQRVLKGELIARPRGYISAPVHATSSGVIVEIGELPVPHPSGLPGRCIVIETDGEERWGQLPDGLGNFQDCSPELLRDRVRAAGIVGLGGAAFPSSVKLNPGPDQAIHTLVLNGAECEPYISCDDMLMRERPERVIAGAGILRHALGTDLCLIGVEDNKPEAIQALRRAIAAADATGIEVVSIPTLYPSGGEKQLIHVLTGKEVPRHGIPAQIGYVCHNVGTAAAIADAVLDGRPLISRLVTVTGEGVREPQNLEVLIGTPVSELVTECGGYTPAASRLILGGPMMGFALHSDQAPITKAANCVFAASLREAPAPGPAAPCIRCGECARVCPAQLLPQQLYWYARAKDLDKVQDYNLFDCIECGCCSYVCPSHIPLVQYFRFGKTESWSKEQERSKSDHARQRHEARVQRLERLENERKARLRKRKEDLGKTGSAEPSGGPAKQRAIQAAVARAQAKKAAQSVAPKNVDQLTPDQQKKIESVEARRHRSARQTDTTGREQ